MLVRSTKDWPEMPRLDPDDIKASLKEIERFLLTLRVLEGGRDKKLATAINNLDSRVTALEP